MANKDNISNKENNMTEAEMRGRRRQRLLVFISVGIIAVALLFTGLFNIMFDKLEKGVLDVCASQQDGYVRLVVDQINLEKDKSDEDIIKNILGTLDSSGEHYWSLSKGSDILYVKNVLETNKYKEVSAASYFSTKSAGRFARSLKDNQVKHSLIKLHGKSYIASGTKFRYGGSSYNLVLLTNPSVILDNNDYLGAKTGILTLLIAALLIMVILPLVLVWGYTRLNRQKVETDRENNKLNRRITKLGGIISDKMFDLNNSQENEEDQMKYRKYELKFYLNAEHYIVINGKRGELHPHTWEFGLTFGLPKDSFVEFGKVEKSIQNYLDGYQNKVMNDIPPFDTIIPTIENIADYFTIEFRKRIQSFDGRLFSVKAAETPTRIYIVGETDEDSDE